MSWAVVGGTSARRGRRPPTSWGTVTRAPRSTRSRNIGVTSGSAPSGRGAPPAGPEMVKTTTERSRLRRPLSCRPAAARRAALGRIVTLTRTAQADEHAVPPPITRSSRLGSWWVIVGFALILLLALGWRFIADPSLSAPTRDPAWYTWRASVILEDDPGSVAGDWGPDNLFSGGYRVTVPLAGALLQRISGISTYSFSAFLMLGMPILTGLALGAGAFRSRGDPLVVLLTMLATAGLFLTTPYVGYLDNITVLFLLSLIVALAGEARTSWGARVAIFLIGMAAAFTHPTTCVLFGVSLLAVWGTHVLTSRFRF